MARSSGTYTAPSNSVNPAVEGTTIDEADFNALVDDLEAALTESVYTAGLGSTDNRLVRTDGTDTKKVQGTGITVDDSDNVTGIAALTVTTVNIGNADTTLARSGAGDLTIEGNAIYRAGGTDVAIADGGTGASSKTAAFDALSPLTTQGDLIYHNGTNNVRLGTGTVGQVLTAGGAGANPSWTTVSGTGDVTAASAFATDNRLIRSDGTGKGVQASGITIDDTDNMSGVVALSATTLELGHASDTTLSRSSAGVLAVEGVTVALNATTATHTAQTIELGHASDTTLARSSAGDVTVEGNTLYRAGGTDVPVADGGTGVSSLTAYAVICGGTTSTGAVQSIASVGTSGQILTSNGAGALPTFQTSAASAGWVKLTSQTASSSASIAFTSNLTSTYDHYMITWTGVVPQTDDVYMRLRVDIGSGYATTNYTWGGQHLSVSGGASTGSTTDSITTSIALNRVTAAAMLGNAAGEQFSGVVYFSDPDATKLHTFFTNSHRTRSSGDAASEALSGQYATSGVISGLQFSMSSGNITSGTFTLYGLTK